MTVTFGDTRVGGVGDEASQTDVEGTAEAAVLSDGGGIFQYAFHVIKLPTHRNYTPPDLLVRLFTHKTCVHTYRKEEQVKVKAEGVCNWIFECITISLL